MHPIVRQKFQLGGSHRDRLRRPVSKLRPTLRNAVGYKPLVQRCFTQRLKRPRKSIFFPKLIWLKVFSTAMLMPEKTASLKTAGRHRGVQHPWAKRARAIDGDVHQLTGLRA